MAQSSKLPRGGHGASRVVTKRKRDIFLAELAITSNVQHACRVAGIDHSSTYKFRARDAEFAARWADAIEQGYQHLEAELLRTARGNAEAGADGGAGDGEARPFDPVLAFKLITRQRKADAQGRRAPVRLKQPDAQEVLRALEKKLTAMEKHLERKR
ncbi:MAG: hypothetical protein JWN21_1875 [Sphingomonas bacterium]|uniref:hypothetical protein n=1 Tax=Sphingomonas bacterium TaxID=1895847 RepID=UPI00260AB037|nr:hypothetical protein [Sphingomonas bacterium]MDB5696332.1 hypothetical protein [Sphingomonas bacterium]